MVAGSIGLLVPSAKVTVSAVRRRTGLPRMLERDSAFAEIAGEEGMEFVEQFLAEGVAYRGAPVNGFHQFRAQGFEITALQAHQVDKTGVSLNLRAREK